MLYICNTSADYISKVNLNSFKEENRIPLSINSMEKNGPHDMCIYNDKLLVANNYSNSLSIIDLKIEKEVNKFFIGMHCNGVAVYDDMAYIICGESNSMIIFNLIKNKIEEEIPCGNLPHSIHIDKQNKIAVISNMQSDNLILIDCVEKEIIKNIKVGSYPTKALFVTNGKNILVCESNIGSDFKGCISIISLKNGSIINRIAAGYSPVDMFLSEECCYVSNFGDGSVSVISLVENKEIKRIKVGGMPRGIVKLDNNIYIGDNYNNLLIEVDVFIEKKRVIPIGKEPTGMMLLCKDIE